MSGTLSVEAAALMRHATGRYSDAIACVALDYERAIAIWVGLAGRTYMSDIPSPGRCEQRRAGPSGQMPWPRHFDERRGISGGCPRLAALD